MGCPSSIAEAAPGRVVLERLRRSLRPDWREYVVLVAERLDGNPFAVLAAIILSQNTSDVNAIRAYERLRGRLGRVTPEAVLSIPEEELVELIRPAGLPRQKARALRALAERLLRGGGERLLLEKPWQELRRWLLETPGVGPKTADVFLSFYRGAPVFAVDTHALRIAKRWGLVGEKAGYEEASRALLDYLGPSDEAHRLLIALGRRWCTARRPRCGECPLRDICPYACRSASKPRGAGGGAAER